MEKEQAKNSQNKLQTSNKNQDKQNGIIKQKKDSACKYSNNKEKMTEYAIALFQNAGTGMQSINDLLDRIKCQHLKSEVQNEYVEFRKIQEKIKDFAHHERIELKDNNIFEKSRMWISVKMSTLFNRSARHIAEMLILGSVMGLNTCYKNRSDYKCVSKELDEIMEELELLLERNYSNLKYFLKN